jgi:hypothetical protein
MRKRHASYIDNWLTVLKGDKIKEGVVFSRNSRSFMKEVAAKARAAGLVLPQNRIGRPDERNPRRSSQPHLRG